MEPNNHIQSEGNKTPPENYYRIFEDVMSNFDGEIDQGIAERLKDETAIADYPAWDFHAQVWFEDGIYYCLIKQYREHIATLEASTLKELMEEACSQYGFD